MRIISGSARGRKLAEFSAPAIRPTPDRVREALFSILSSRLGSLGGKTVLDLFAGSGAMGLEALSRGAEKAVFIDQSAEAVALIRKNADTTRLADRARIVRGEVERCLNGLAPFDLIFMDPPYSSQQVPEVVEALCSRKLLQPAGLLCIETARKTELPDALAGLERVDRRDYGATSITLYRHGESDL